ncbi:alpha/beta hydrolase [Plantactinospora soyae]|uniref:Peptidase S33 tripeptidyl aminopeptidase-like C-terminal domain-containing protein n=1 Tax=Plantactinospora soyae TaxID=1544732 RepID=A0A927MAG6_9ACTN|nr:alpha/beta hydrolase [Plantactinospora soyae]MBE1488258.1 hypothetical protein [Plantactinospora soyae]
MAAQVDADRAEVLGERHAVPETAVFGHAVDGEEEGSGAVDVIGERDGLDHRPDRTRRWCPTECDDVPVCRTIATSLGWDRARPTPPGRTSARRFCVYSVNRSACKFVTTSFFAWSGGVNSDGTSRVGCDVAALLGGCGGWWYGGIGLGVEEGPTVEGEGHTIVSSGKSECVDTIAADYLIDLKLPASMPTCSI